MNIGDVFDEHLKLTDKFIHTVKLAIVEWVSGCYDELENATFAIVRDRRIIATFFIVRDENFGTVTTEDVELSGDIDSDTILIPAEEIEVEHLL